MASPTEISDLLNSITRDIRTIISDEIALVKAEIKPAVRHVGVGSGMFGAAAYFAISATIILWFVFAAGFAWLYASVTSLSAWGAAFWGMFTAMFLVLIIAGVFVVIGLKNFKQVRGPEKAPESIGKTFSAFASGLEDGGNRVKAEVSGRSADEWISSRPVAPVGGQTRTIEDDPLRTDLQGKR
ncbi:MAG: phage holin family protein [Propionibacteriaceae bacterium]|jgi:hypothetical protein|nr:phage holin family protein [Propionibacteriaceae bacterium]